MDIDRDCESSLTQAVVGGDSWDVCIQKRAEEEIRLMCRKWNDAFSSAPWTTSQISTFYDNLGARFALKPERKNQHLGVSPSLIATALSPDQRFRMNEELLNPVLPVDEPKETRVPADFSKQIENQNFVSSYVHPDDIVPPDFYKLSHVEGCSILLRAALDTLELYDIQILNIEENLNGYFHRNHSACFNDLTTVWKIHCQKNNWRFLAECSDDCDCIPGIFRIRQVVNYVTKTVHPKVGCCLFAANGSQSEIDQVMRLFCMESWQAYAAVYLVDGHRLIDLIESFSLLSLNLGCEVKFSRMAKDSVVVARDGENFLSADGYELVPDEYHEMHSTSFVSSVGIGGAESRIFIIAGTDGSVFISDGWKMRDDKNLQHALAHGNMYTNDPLIPIQYGSSHAALMSELRRLMVQLICDGPMATLRAIVEPAAAHPDCSDSDRVRGIVFPSRYRPSSSSIDNTDNVVVSQIDDSICTPGNEFEYCRERIEYYVKWIWNKDESTRSLAFPFFQQQKRPEKYFPKPSWSDQMPPHNIRRHQKVRVNNDDQTITITSYMKSEYGDIFSYLTSTVLDPSFQNLEGMDVHVHRLELRFLSDSNKWSATITAWTHDILQMSRSYYSSAEVRDAPYPPVFVRRSGGAASSRFEYISFEDAPVRVAVEEIIGLLDEVTLLSLVGSFFTGQLDLY